MIEDEGGGRYRLSDLRQGRDKAEVLGVAATYRHQTQEVARLSGLTLEGNALVLPGVFAAAQLVASTMTVANAAARALERASLRAASRPREDTIERLIARLGTVFPKAQVKRGEDVRGASTHAWQVDAVVTTRQPSGSVRRGHLKPGFHRVDQRQVPRLRPPGSAPRAGCRGPSQG